MPLKYHMLVLVIIAAGLTDTGTNAQQSPSNRNIRQNHPFRGWQSRRRGDIDGHDSGENRWRPHPEPRPEPWTNNSQFRGKRRRKPEWEHKKTTKMGQCPCVKKQGSNTCIGYNPVYQATNLEEAILHFDRPNKGGPLRSEFRKKPSAKVEEGVIAPYFKCSSADCQDCAGYLLNWLELQLKQQANQMSNETRFDFESQLLQLKRKYKASSKSSQCKGIQFEGVTSGAGSRKPETPVRVTPKQLKKLNKAILGTSKTFGASQPTRKAAQMRADTGLFTPSEFETVFKLECLRRGEPVEPGSSYLNLCTSCWQWGILPSNYYPQVINMMTCDEIDYKCLSGWGDCRQRTRSIQVVKNEGTEDEPRYEPYSIDAPVCCDCQVKAGTGLHNLVRGDPD